MSVLPICIFHQDLTETKHAMAWKSSKASHESMRKDTLEFAKEKYFNGHSDTRSVQENFDLLTSFIQDSADKHIPSKTSRSVSSIPWITPEIRRTIRRKIKLMQRQKRQAAANFDQNLKL